MTLLADTSIWIRALRGDMTARGMIEAAAESGCLVTCAPVRLELMRGSGGSRRMDELDRNLRAAQQLRVGEAAWIRADEVVRDLALLAGGRHRGPSVSDLLVAAVAERAGATVMHDDVDFDVIAEVTGQPVSRLRSR